LFLYQVEIYNCSFLSYLISKTIKRLNVWMFKRLDFQTSGRLNVQTFDLKIKIVINILTLKRLDV
jgi:hypothetical protein